MRMRRTASLLPAVLLIASCNLQKPLIEGPFRFAVMYGLVASEAGVGLAGVRVALQPDPEGQCPATRNRRGDVAPTVATTDAAGRFRVSVVQGKNFESACVWIEVTPPAALGVRDTSISVGPVRFTLRDASDSVRTDVTLAAR